MLIKIDTSALRQAKWHEYLVRFISGGIITAATGIIAKKCGPAIGGLFLAFPAIFPASVTLIDKHEKEKKQKAGFDGRMRARKIVAVDAAGAAMGSLGLLAFALFVWQLLPKHSVALVLIGATVLWLIVSVLVWWTRKRT